MFSTPPLIVWHTCERKHYTLTLLRENIMCTHTHTHLWGKTLLTILTGKEEGGSTSHTQTSPSSPMSHLGMEDVWERRRMWKAIPHRCCPPHCHPSVGCCAARRPRPRPGNSSALTTRGEEREETSPPPPSLWFRNNLPLPHAACRGCVVIQMNHITNPSKPAHSF